MTTERTGSTGVRTRLHSLAWAGRMLDFMRTCRARLLARGAGDLEVGNRALERQLIRCTLVLLMALSGSAVACSDKGPSEPSQPAQPWRIDSISPTSVAAGSPDVTVALKGSGFSGGVFFSQAFWRANGITTALATTFVDSTELMAVVPAALLLDTVSAQVYVLTRDRSEGTTVSQTNAVPFTVTSVPLGPAHPTIYSISPTSAVAGSPDLTLSVVGVNFGRGRFRKGSFTGSQVVWSTKGTTTELVTTFVSITELDAVVPTELLRDTVVAHVYLLTGDSMEDLPLDHSNEVAFTVTPAPPD